jgi:hypothetical protein
MQATRKESQPTRAERVLFLPRVCLKFRFVDPLHRARSREETSSSRDIRPYSKKRRTEGRGGEGGGRPPPRLRGYLTTLAQTCARARARARAGSPREANFERLFLVSLLRFSFILFLFFFSRSLSLFFFCGRTRRMEDGTRAYRTDTGIWGGMIFFGD